MSNVLEIDDGFGNAIQVSTYLVEDPTQYLELGDYGVIQFQAEPYDPEGFHVLTFVTSDGRSMVNQKDLGQRGGGYSRPLTTDFEVGVDADYKAFGNYLPMIVQRDGKSEWMPWKGDENTSPNRLDIWRLQEDGRISLVQAGIVSHDDGATWRLLCRMAWRGRLFKFKGKIVGRPEAPVWGSFTSREQILEDEDFQALLRASKIDPLNGNPADLNPPLPKSPNGGIVVVDWYTPYMGKKGQGIVIGSSGKNYWIHGEDILDPPGPDGIKLPQRGDLYATEDLAEPKTGKLLKVVGCRKCA